MTTAPDTIREIRPTTDERRAAEKLARYICRVCDEVHAAGRWVLGLASTEPRCALCGRRTLVGIATYEPPPELDHAATDAQGRPLGLVIYAVCEQCRTEANRDPDAAVFRLHQAIDRALSARGTDDSEN